MIAGKNKFNIGGFSSIFSGAEVDRAVGNALIIEPIDLNEAAALTANTYYRHVGSTNEDYIKNIIYFYDGKSLTPVTGGSKNKVEANVQSDWNQNDDTAADYIKNRPFYSEKNNSLDKILFSFDFSEYNSTINKGKLTILNEEYNISLQNSDKNMVFGYIVLNNGKLGTCWYGVSDGVPEFLFECPMDTFLQSDIPAQLKITSNGEENIYSYIVDESGTTLIVKYGDQSTFCIAAQSEGIMSIELLGDCKKIIVKSVDETVSPTQKITKTSFLDMGVRCSNLEEENGLIYYIAQDPFIFGEGQCEPIYVGDNYFGKAATLTDNETNIVITLHQRPNNSFINVATGDGCAFCSNTAVNIPENVTILYNNIEYNCSRNEFLYNGLSFYVYGNLSYLSNDILLELGLSKFDDTKEPFIFCSNFNLINGFDKGLSFFGMQPLQQNSVLSICTLEKENINTEKIKTIDKKFLPKDTFVLTLNATDWENNTQTINVIGIDNDSLIFVSPAGDPTNYANAGIWCSKQGENSLTFTCAIIPETDIKVNILIR